MKPGSKRLIVLLVAGLTAVGLVFVVGRALLSPPMDDGVDHPSLQPISPDGDWRLARSGSERGVEWKLYLSAAKPTGTCASLELTPAPREDDSRISSLRYRGREATCVTEPHRSDAVFAPLVLIQALQSPEVRYNVVAGIAADRVDQLAVTLDDRTTSIVPVVDRTFVVIYDRTSLIESIRVIESDGDEVSLCDVVTIAPPSGGLDLRCQRPLS
ncbi:MAG: hypothetical protein LC808_14235 [Actinobacteria bacterium]|nr:hypothetical protein [Actinomycetota bacterium]